MITFAGSLTLLFCAQAPAPVTPALPSGTTTTGTGTGTTTGRGSAEVAKPELSWATLLPQVDAAFDARASASSGALESAAWRAARDAVGPWEDLSVDGSGEVDLQGAQPAEISVSATVGRRLGDRTDRWRQTYRAQGEVLKTQRATDRLAFRFDAIARFQRWWEASQDHEHTHEMFEAQRRYVAQLARGLDNSLVPASMVAEARSELAVLRGRVLAAKVERDNAHRRLHLLMGRVRPTLKPARAASLGFKRPNPWATYLQPGALAHHPALVKLRRRAEKAYAEASAQDAESAASLNFGAGIRQVGGGSTYGVLLIGGRFGLSGEARAQAHIARGEAKAATLRHDQVQMELGRWLKAEAARWKALVSQHGSLRETVEAPLRRRATKLAKAVSGGFATMGQLVRVRRDLHEAMHQRLAVEAELWASQARASAIARPSKEATP